MNPNVIRCSSLNRTNFASKQLYWSKNLPEQTNISKEASPRANGHIFRIKKINYDPLKPVPLSSRYYGANWSKIELP